MSNNQFSGVFIPREVLLDEDISASGKIIFAIIQSLDNDKGCFASNEYIGKMLGLSDSSVRCSIADLERKKYLIRTIDENGNRTITTCTTASLCGDDRQKTGTTPPENKRTPRQKTGVYSNKDNNSNNIQGYLLPPIPHDDEFANTWGTWVQYRKERKKPLTNQTVKLQLEFLTKLTKHDATDSILKSIQNGWLGLFAPVSKGNPYSTKKLLTEDDHGTF
jgi:biotin operon repressor